MKQYLAIIFTFFLFALVSPAFANAIYDPLSVENNLFGIHIIDETDLDDAANLVNTSNGQWGYVTIVISENDRNIGKWQKIFDKMRELKLIPLIRLATAPSGSNWKKPESEDATEWVSFLNSLNWVVKNRYVILFNEPNHDKEWGGSSSATEYSEIVKVFRDELKKASDDYFILSAGLDLAAGNTKGTTNASDFYKQMYDYDKEIFQKFDGLASHSYPNPGFVGHPDDNGKNSIRGYQWELGLLTPLGLKSNIPIFITETGWSRSETRVLPLADYYKSAFENAWKHPQIVAVTPFVLNYEAPPFDNFSWRDTSKLQKVYFSQYEEVSKIQKKQGKPTQVNDYKFLEAPIPSELISDSTYMITPQITNSGQSIWYEKDITTKVVSNFPNQILIDEVPYLTPYESFDLPIHIQTPNELGNYNLIIEFFYKGNPIGEKLVRSIEVVPPTEIKVNMNLGWKRNSSTSQVKLLIYEADVLIKELKDLNVDDGQIKIDQVHDVIPGRTYRFVIVKNGYLTRDTVTFLNSQGSTILDFGRLTPFDFNGDGNFTAKDIVSGILNPVTTLKLLSPF